MKSDSKSDSERKRKRVVNIVEVGDEGLVYIRLDNGKKYLLNGSGCWRCGSTANCFGNMDDSNKLEVICEFDFYDEVRGLFLVLLQDRITKCLNWLTEKVPGALDILVDGLADVFARTLELVNLY